ncbi:hypothetical protein [Chryseobacterium paridis]|uniref:Uncharacterized protein n=1 Tax=Chryseobacterium paridis TaxID=2800328 RepID=A0ABS1FY43_9FLAO|nr:hypothetical protein [Chryseobacterium paridis]MBK1897377.1 hypothetical protein [Chryseobacterium paridis]
METKIIELIHIIKRRPGMVFFDGTNAVLKDYIHFFEGFFYSLEFTLNMNFEREISKWYQKRTDFIAPNMNWFAQFEHINKDLIEKEKIEKLLNTLEDFFNYYNTSSLT